MKKALKRTIGIIFMIAAVAAFAFVMQELLGNDGSNESLTLKSF